MTKKLFIGLALMGILISILLNIYLGNRLSVLEGLVYSTESQRQAMGFPFINYDILNTQDFQNCVNTTHERYKREHGVDATNRLTPSLRIYVDGGIAIDKLTYQINQIHGVRVYHIEEKLGIVDLEIINRDDLREYAYWICFFDEQEFAKNPNYGVGSAEDENYFIHD